MPVVGKVLVDEAEVLDLIDQLKVAVPRSVREAKALLQERERILEQARAEAEHMLAEAQRYAEAKASQSEVVLIAQRQAAELRQEAEREAERLIEEARRRAAELVGRAEEEAARREAEADRYVREVLTDLEGRLTGALAAVKKGLGAAERSQAAGRRVGRNAV